MVTLICVYPGHTAWDRLLACWTHNPPVLGSSPSRPTNQIGHCTNTGYVGDVGMPCARDLRDAEHGNDLAWPGDLDLGDQGFEERFALFVAASDDDLVDMVGDLAQRGGRRHRRLCVELGGELGVAG